MKKLFLFTSSLMLCMSMWAQSPIGFWKTIDDETNKPKSIVQVYEVNGKLHAKVVKIFLGPDEAENPMCDKCKGAKKDQPILGMEIMYGLEQDDDEWEDGKIMDPKSGKEYSCHLTLEDKDTLKVRGFIGFSLIGRTQYWYRTEKP
ncbi:MAG: DUF2147 domain-containing protein [Bacteroidota bacterium]